MSYRFTTEVGSVTARQTKRPALAEAYARSQAINRAHGRSYYLATRLLPAAKRPHVHALYGFTRCADDIVDTVGPEDGPQVRQQRLDDWGSAFLAGLAGAPVSRPAAAGRPEHRRAPMTWISKTSTSSCAAWPWI